jgi:undecaprenyl diphosphate synthase
VFSIENFKRDQEEVDSLLDLFREKIRLLIAEEKKLAEHGVRVKLIGMRNVKFFLSKFFSLYFWQVGVICDL